MEENTRLTSLKPKEQRQKLDEKATPCVLLGYEDEEFCYYLLDPEK